MNTNGSLFREKGQAIYRTNKTVDVEKFIYIANAVSVCFYEQTSQ